MRILRSGLPIYWGPCFGDEPYITFWKFRHSEVLGGASFPVQNFFLYALGKVSPEQTDPIAALTSDIDRELMRKFWDRERNMWCPGTFLHAAGRMIVESADEGWTTIPTSALSTIPSERRADVPIYSYEKVQVHVSDDGTTRIGSGVGTIPILTYRRCPGPAYDEALTDALRGHIAQVARP